MTTTITRAEVGAVRDRHDDSWSPFRQHETLTCAEVRRFAQSCREDANAAADEGDRTQLLAEAADLDALAERAEQPETTAG